MFSQLNSHPSPSNMLIGVDINDKTFSASYLLNTDNKIYPIFNYYTTFETITNNNQEEYLFGSGSPSVLKNFISLYGLSLSQIQSLYAEQVNNNYYNVNINCATDEQNILLFRTPQLNTIKLDDIVHNLLLFIINEIVNFIDPINIPLNYRKKITFSYPASIVGDQREALVEEFNKYHVQHLRPHFDTTIFAPETFILYQTVKNLGLPFQCQAQTSLLLHNFGTYYATSGNVVTCVDGHYTAEQDMQFSLKSTLETHPNSALIKYATQMQLHVSDSPFDEIYNWVTKLYQGDDSIGYWQTDRTLATITQAEYCKEVVPFYEAAILNLCEVLASYNLNLAQIKEIIFTGELYCFKFIKEFFNDHYPSCTLNYIPTSNLISEGAVRLCNSTLVEELIKYTING